MQLSVCVHSHGQISTTNHCWCYEPTLAKAKSSSFSSTLLIEINSCQPRSILLSQCQFRGASKFSPETHAMVSHLHPEAAQNAISGVIQPFLTMIQAEYFGLCHTLPATKKPCCRSLHTIKHLSAAPEGAVLARHPRHPQATHPEVRHLKLVPHAKWDPPGDVWSLKFSIFFYFSMDLSPSHGLLMFFHADLSGIIYFFHRNFHQQRKNLRLCSLGGG